MGEAVTPAFLIAAGLVAAVTAVVGVLVEPTGIGPSPFVGSLELLMLAVPAVGLTAAGYWLTVGDFDPADVWRVGTYAVGGAVVGMVSTVVVLSLVPTPSLDTVSTFVLFVATGTEGSLLGVVAGTFAATDRLLRRERRIADEFETLQALLRHDLRNRLTIIHGHLTRIAEVTDTPADSVATIETQLEAIESILADTGVATRALRGHASLEPVDLVAVVHEQVALLEESYDGVTVTTELPDAAWVSADDLLGSVLDNLLSNAVRHHDGPAAEIEVRVEVTDDHVRLEVADDGPGIPAGRRDEVFEPGVGDSTGMGLYLVETVVDRYGGSVALDGNEPRGTVVTVTLPGADPLSA